MIRGELEMFLLQNKFPIFKKIKPALTKCSHYIDVIMITMASRITRLTVGYSIIYSGVDQRKHQCSASLAFVWGIPRGPMNSLHKWPVTQKMLSLDDVIMRKISIKSVLKMLMTWYSSNWANADQHCVTPLGFPVVWHIGAETKWQIFCKVYFQMLFHESKLLYRNAIGTVDISKTKLRKNIYKTKSWTFGIFTTNIPR